MSSWKVRCGISTFSEQLAAAYAARGRAVFVDPIVRWADKHGAYYNWLAARLPDVDLVVCEHEYGLFQGQEGVFYQTLAMRGLSVVTEMHSVGLSKLDNLILANSAAVIVHNRWCADQLPRNDKTVIFPHPVPKLGKVWDKEKARTGIGIPKGKKVAMMFGFVTEAKGHGEAIRAVASLPEDVVLVIAGGWHLEEPTAFHSEMRALSAKLLGPRGLWIGYVPETRMDELFSAADLMVYPYLRMTESGALAEAFAHGKAVLASPLPPMREKEKVGALETYGNQDDLPKRMMALLDDPARRAELEAGAAKYAAKNSYYKVAGRHLKLLDAVVGGGAVKRS